MHDWLRTALDACAAAAQVHQAHRGSVTMGAAREKGRRDYVTEVDLESQRAALAIIGARHPDHQILAEEEGGSVAGPPLEDGQPLWIVDPLDGTTNFLHGFPMFCASVAVAVDLEVKAGAVVSSATGERWWASSGSGAFKDDDPIHVSRENEMANALVGTGFPFKEPLRIPEYLGQLGRVLEHCSGVRRGGSAALDLCMLAEGALDGFWEMALSPWDFAAGLIILSEAGGIYTRMDGSPVDPREPGSVLAANGPTLLHALGSLVEPEDLLEMEGGG